MNCSAYDSNFERPSAVKPSSIIDKTLCQKSWLFMVMVGLNDVQKYKLFRNPTTESQGQQKLRNPSLRPSCGLSHSIKFFTAYRTSFRLFSEFLVFGFHALLGLFHGRK